MELKRRLTVLVGNYGSGKTELSIQLALERAKRGRAALVDMDIVNPYFRSAERRALLEQAGVRVLAPTFAMSTVDIPALPAEIRSVFDMPEERVVFDVGGDDTGAAALGVFAHDFQRETPDVLFVVNVLRPLSATAEDICDLIDRVSARARLSPTMLVNNANLAGETTPDMLVDAQRVLREVTARTGVPVGMVTGEESVLRALPDAMRAMAVPLQRRMTPEWM